ncbi:macrophage mannose receptor 1-like isoform X2 [Acipenser ruthenus]|uniref:macrophage mannose receptor 1-like isoform X2 n=1 Tax=Acipenser ruthenus TaxID=7906 RepID=UPI002741D887|nr:macrophage mannose receptor 1-like isoform X2 [Acipenser ruthenus]
MEKLVLLMLLLAGICAVASGHFRKYHFVEDKKSWFDAQSYCREKHTDLATIESQEETEKVLNISAAFTDAWIGLYYDKENWQWSNGDNVSYYNWTSSLNCTSIDSSGKWVDSYCHTNSYYFICYNDTRESYILIDQPKTWYEAQQYCRKNYIDLVSIKNNDEDKKIKEKANGKTVWIGLFNNPWKWSHKGEYSSFHNWNKWEPNNVVNNICVAMYGAADMERGKWNDDGCHCTAPFFCYNDTSERYILIDKPKTWYEAQQYCREHHTDLVSVKNEDENKKIKEKANGNPVWIGLFNNPWKWSDGGDNYTPQNWSVNQPDNYGGKEKCVMIQNKTNKLTINDGGCSTAYPFFCYDDTTPSVPPSATASKDHMAIARVKLTAPRGMNLEDPKVSEAILEQIREHFSKKFPMDGVKMRWRKQDGEIFHKDVEEEEEEEEKYSKP